MKIKDVEIIDLQLLHSIPGAKQRRTMYEGSFVCVGCPLNGRKLVQLSVTKVAWWDEHGDPQWGDPVTTFSLRGDALVFKDVESLISYYNERDTRAVTLNGRKVEINRDGSLILINGVQVHISCGMIRFSKKAYTVPRIIALAWVENPTQAKYLRYIDGNRQHVTAANLEWTNMRGFRREQLSTATIVRLKKLRKLGLPVAEIAEKCKISCGAVTKYTKS